MSSLELAKKIKIRQGMSSSTKKSLTCPVHFIDIANDFNAGFMLNQIVYWFSENDDGEVRAKVYKDGKLCVAKSKKGWEEELKLSEKQVRRCEKILTELNLINIKKYKFNGTPTNHYFLNWENFLELEEKVLSGQMESDQRADSKPTKGHIPNRPKGTLKTDQRADSLTEITTKITTEITTEEEGEEKSTPTGEEQKQTYSEYVLLTEKEHQKLIDDYNEQVITEYIEKLNDYIASQGLQKKYKSHYHTIKNWLRRDGVQVKNETGASNNAVDELKAKLGI